MEICPPWTDFRAKSADTLLITFSALNTPRGRFTPFQAIKGLGYSVLRFNCPNDQWYLRGLPDSGEPYEAFIARFMALHDFGTVALYGNSMGGFAALDIGLRIRSDVIVTAGVETIMGLPAGYAARDITPDLQRAGVARIRDWPALNAATPRRLYALYGENSRMDVTFAVAFERLMNVDPIILAGADHSVPKLLATRHSLGACLENLIERGSDAFIDGCRANIDLSAHYGTVAQMERDRDAKLGL